MVARVAPAVLELLGDGVPRSRRAIVAALVDQHPKDEVKRTLMRGVPFLVVSGYSETQSRAPELSRAPRLAKPVSHRQLLHALRRALVAVLPG